MGQRGLWNRPGVIDPRVIAAALIDTCDDFAQVNANIPFSVAVPLG